MIISFLNQKGGVGKTTLATNTAGAFASAGHKTLLIDADPQQTAAQWASLREDMPFTVTSLARPKMAKDALGLAADYSHTVIDGPARGQDIAYSVIIASDLVIVPIEPGGPSVWAAAETIEAIQNARNIKDHLKAAFLVSRKHGNTVIGREARQYASEEGIPIMETEIHNRVAFAEALTLGKTITEWSGKSAAAKEIKQLSRELIKHYEQEDVYGRAPADTAAYS